ncbi:esterase/lipase family protein [Halopelagius fulvigenes]|uniref:Esterase/lipase family protein n=1 Tax=Halopelagius fulvigenes TaxID=1198324 RepID=A0ABD5TYY5_9EURY
MAEGTSAGRRTNSGDAGDDLLVVLGWGNRPEHEHVSWLLDSLVEAGYRVHAVTLPTNPWDFEDQLLAPVRAYARERDIDLVLSHSTGGLVAAHLAADADVRNVFLSPWWGTAPVEGVASVALPLLLRIPTARRLLRFDRDPSVIGDLVTEAQFEEAVPEAASPAFLRTVLDAQSRLPPFDEGDAVFCSLSDRVVSVRAIGDRTPAANLRPYDGGHEFFASSGREAVLEDVLAALEAGPEAIRRAR